MCKLYKYQEVDSATGTVYETPARPELCSRSRHGQPCSATQEFRRPIGELGPQANYDQFPPTPPLSHSSRSSRSPSTSDTERHARKRSDTYYVSDGVKVAISHNSSSSPARRRRGSSVSISVSPSPPRREKNDHVAFVEPKSSSTTTSASTAAQRSNTKRRVEIATSRRPPSPAESDVHVYKPSYRELIEERERDRDLDHERERDLVREKERERDPSPLSSVSTTTTKTARPVKKVIIAENPSHKKHGSKSGSRSGSVSGDEDPERVRYYATTGESIRSKIDRQNEEIANRPIAPRERERKREREQQEREQERERRREQKEREARESREVVRHPRPSREVAPPPSASGSTGSNSSASRSNYRRGSVQVSDVVAPLTAQYNTSMSLYDRADKERRRHEREERREDEAMRARLKERLGRRNTVSAAPGALARIRDPLDNGFRY